MSGWMKLRELVGDGINTSTRATGLPQLFDYATGHASAQGATKDFLTNPIVDAAALVGGAYLAAPATASAAPGASQGAFGASGVPWAGGVDAGPGMNWGKLASTGLNAYSKGLMAKRQNQPHMAAAVDYGQPQPNQAYGGITQPNNAALIKALQNGGY